MRLIKIYYLHENHITQDEAMLMREGMEANFVIFMKADNQLEGIQYPIIEVEDF